MGRPSAKNYYFFWKIFAEGFHEGPRQIFFIFFKKSLPRASNHGPRQRNVAEILIFLKKIFAEGNGTALGKELFFFWKIFAEGVPASPRQRFFLKKSLCRGPLTMALGKEILQKFYFF